MAHKGNIWWTQRDTSNKFFEVKEYCQTHLGCTPKHCADALGISRRTVQRHLATLRMEWPENRKQEAA